MSLNDFMKCAQKQDDYLSERGYYNFKEMFINPELKKSLSLGSSITLNHAGELPLIEDPSIPLFMFRGFSYDRSRDTSPTLKTTEELLAAMKGERKQPEVPPPAPVPTPKLPINKRKRARQNS